MMSDRARINLRESRMTTIGSRAYGALLGMAVGDALGMPTQSLPRPAIVERYGVIDRFHPGPADNEISHGMPAGSVTDDTDQALIIARLLIEGNGQVDPHRLAELLLTWQTQMVAAGSADLLGPSTLRALRAVSSGEPPTTSGRWGDTNGAAMRIPPVGIATSCDIERLVTAVHAASLLTHNTGTAIAGAAAVAAAISSGVAGRTFPESVEFAISAARVGAERGFYAPGADVAARIGWAIDLVSSANDEDAAELIYTLVGVGLATQEAVPAAFAVASIFPDDLWSACRCAASLGGDCDTIAAMTGALVGAHTGPDLPADIVSALELANPDLRLTEISELLVQLRENE